MALIFKKTLLAIALFLATPLVAIFANWHWQPNLPTTISYYLLQITKTASFPFACMTLVILFLLFSRLISIKKPSKIILLWIILFLTLATGQLIKSVTKAAIKEPRPYVMMMEKSLISDQRDFYALPKTEKKQLITEYVNQNSTIPNWLAKHWESEMDYSFPSGHTLFAVTFAFLALLLLGFKRHPIIVSLTVLWAIMIEISRLVLGAHHPQDLMMAVIISWVISTIGYFCIKKCHLIE